MGTAEDLEEVEKLEKEQENLRRLQEEQDEWSRRLDEDTSLNDTLWSSGDSNWPL